MISPWRAATATEMRSIGSGSEDPFGTFKPNALQSALIGLASHTILKRGVFRRFTTHLVLKLGAGKIDIRFRGGSYRLRGDDNLIEYGLLLNPDYNATDLNFLMEGAPKDANFVDAGSNIGLYTLPLAVQAPLGRTLAIDANPRMTSQLRWNVEATGLENVTILNAGLSDRPGRAKLNIAKGDVAIVAITEAEDGDIPIATLSDALNEAGIDCVYGLKIDIEGHEDRVLVPFLDETPIEHLPKRIVIEHLGEEDYPACKAAFERHGYTRLGRSRNNSFYARR